MTTKEEIRKVTISCDECGKCKTFIIPCSKLSWIYECPRCHYRTERVFTELYDLYNKVKPQE